MIARIAFFVAAIFLMPACAWAEPESADEASQDHVASDVAKGDLVASHAMRSVVPFSPIELPPREKLRIAVLTTFWIVWFFFLGAALGSYLNVVVYRMPLGLNTVSPVSRCPKCQTAIRPRDNIPVLSWLLLRGRCRSCGEPISARYVIVEVVMGMLFVGLLFVDVLSGGAKVWLRGQHVTRNLPMLEHFLEFDLIKAYFYHAALIWFIVGIVLFRIDRQKVPPRFILVGLLIGLLPLLVGLWL